MAGISTVMEAADSLRSGSVDQAFTAGRLVMDHGTSGTDPALVQLWGDSIVNSALVSAAILLAVILLPAILETLPVVLSGFMRTKPILNLDNNTSQARTRNQVAWTSFLAISLFCARYSLVKVDFLDGKAAGISTLVTVAAVFAYLILRLILSSMVKPSGRKKEYFKAADSIFYNYAIILAAIMAVTAAFAAVTGMNDLTVRSILIYESAGMAAVLILRKLEILSDYCNLLLGILYLCALEIFPAGLLIAASLLF